MWRATDKLIVNATFLQHNNEAGARDTVTVDEMASSSDQRVLPNADGSIPPTHTNNDYDIYNILLTYDLGFADIISSSTKYNSTAKTSSNSSILEAAFAPGSEVGLLVNEESSLTKGFTQEVRMSGGGDAWGWTIGLFLNDYDHEVVTEGDQVFLNGEFLGGNPPASFTLSSTSTALFGQIYYDINEQFTIAIGTRYFEDEREMTGSFFSETRNEKFDNLSSNVSLSYTISENSNIYLSVAEGFRSGGLNFFSDLAYEPESVTAYEIGIKSLLLNGRLRTEAAIYFNDYTDYQANVLTPDLGPSIIQNPGEAEIQGFEISSQFKVSPLLSLGFNGNITDPEFTKISSDSTGVFNVGDPISFIPEYSYSFYTDFNFNWSSTTAGFTRIDYNRQGPSSHISRSLFLVPIDESSAIGFLNAQIGAQLGDNLTIRLFAKNINNELRSPFPSLAGKFTQNRPRTIGVDFNYEF